MTYRLERFNRIVFSPALLTNAFKLLLIIPGMVVAQIPQIPQIPAFLPKAEQVAVSQTMPIDGIWIINTIGKKIRMEGGRAIVIDGWLHLFVLDVQPGMVVLQNIVPTKPGQYNGDDLPLMGKLTAKVQADRSISVSVATALGPINYKLIPVQIDNPQWYDQEMQAAGLSIPSGGPATTPSYQFTPPVRNGQPVTRPPVYTPTPRDNAPAVNIPPSSQSQPSDNDCEQQKYDPITDTISCYTEGQE